MQSSRLIYPFIYVFLCLIWGSSFILMKWGLYDNHNQVLLTAWQVAAIRVLSAGIVLLPLLPWQVRQVRLNQLPYVLLSGVLGVFAPAFLFCLAETRIDSALAGILNALTPFFAILFGFLLYRQPVPGRQVLGLLTGLAGLILLFLAKGQIRLQYLGYAGFVLLATICYGINLNMVKYRLQGVPSLSIATISFTALVIPAAVILLYTGYFRLPLQDLAYIRATMASCTLGVLGSAISWILFFILIKRTGPVFASSVTYITPLVALGWGWYYGEQISFLQAACLLLILLGVYLTNPILKKRREGSNQPALRAKP